MDSQHENRLAELIEECRNVPFGNSKFQIECFIAGGQAPERLYRNCLLQFDQKMLSLQSTKFSRDRRKIDVEELEHKIHHNSAFGYDLKRLQVDLEEKKYHLAREEKLIEDCMIEINTYVEILNKLPKFTREQFESAEIGYWSKRLIHESNVQLLTTGSVDPGTAGELSKLGIGLARSPEGKLGFSFLKLEDQKEA